MLNRASLNRDLGVPAIIITKLTLLAIKAIFQSSSPGQAKITVLNFVF